MIGDKLSPVLEEIEDTLLEFAVNSSLPPKFSKEGFRAATYIFMSTFMDKMWEYQESKNIGIYERQQQAEKVGYVLRELIKDFTGIDTHLVYEIKK